MNNEQDIFTKLVEKAKSNQLTEREKRALFLSVDTYVENNPIFIKETGETGAATRSPSASPTQTPKWARPIPSPFTSDTFQSFIASWHIHSFKTVIAVFVIMIFGVGGSSLAAQNSLPGNFLYPIKVNINEGVKAVLLSGPARAAYEVERVKNRIDEAKQLVAQNKFTDKVQGELATRLNVHISSVQKDVVVLTKKGDLKAAFEISNDLENSLEESQASVAALPEESVSDQELASINEIISAPLQASTVTRENAEDQISTLQVNDESTKAIAVAKFESATKLIETLDENNEDVDVEIITPDVAILAPILAKTAPVAPAVATTAPATLAEARELVEQGEQKLQEQEYDAAFSLFKEAFDIAQGVQSVQIQENLQDVETEAKSKAP